MEDYNVKSDVRELSLQEIDLVAGGDAKSEFLLGTVLVVTKLLGATAGALSASDPPMPTGPLQPMFPGQPTGGGSGGNCPSGCHGNHQGGIT